VARADEHRGPREPAAAGRLTVRRARTPRRVYVPLMADKSWLCATCLRAGTKAPAVTIVDGTAVCADHLPEATKPGRHGVAVDPRPDLGELDQGIQHHMK